MRPDLNPYQLIIFDADGTLRRTTIHGQPCPNAPDQWELMPYVQEGIATIPTHITLGLVSNQAGVAAGFLTERIAYTLLCDLYHVATAKWPAREPQHSPLLEDVIRYCPHAVDAGCICRKPSPDMIFYIMRVRGLRIGRKVLYVGDLDSDRRCAERAGVDFCWAQDFFTPPNGAPTPEEDTTCEPTFTTP